MDNPSGLDNEDQFRRGLIGYYIAMTVFGVFAGIAALAFFFERNLAGAAATVITLVSSVYCWKYLKINRGETG